MSAIEKVTSASWIFRAFAWFGFTPFPLRGCHLLLLINAFLLFAQLEGHRNSGNCLRKSSDRTIQKMSK